MHPCARHPVALSRLALRRLSWSRLVLSPPALRRLVLSPPALRRLVLSPPALRRLVLSPPVLGRLVPRRLARAAPLAAVRLPVRRWRPCCRSRELPSMCRSPIWTG